MDIDSQYDFFKFVNLDDDGNIGVVIDGGLVPNFEWTELIPAVGFSSFAGFQPMSYRKDVHTVFVSGILERTGSLLVPNNTLIGTLPVGFRPSNEMVIYGSMGTSPNSNNGDSIFNIKTNGEITLTNANILNSGDVVRISGEVIL